MELNLKDAKSEIINKKVSLCDSSSSEDEDEKEEKDEKNMTISKVEKEKEAEKIEKTFTQRIKDFFKTKTKEYEEQSPLIEDENRTLEEIVRAKGFKFQTHSVKTEDGYTLTLFRIPGGKNCENGDLLPPVLLQHGVFDSADGWVCNGENHSIPFVLANNNFDVWLSNSRGNKYCRVHEKFDIKSFELAIFL